MTAVVRCADPSPSSVASPLARATDPRAPEGAVSRPDSPPGPDTRLRDGPGCIGATAELHAPGLGLSYFERRAVTGLVARPGEEMERETAVRAAGYATGDPDVRRRALARAAAVQDGLAQELTALLAAAVRRRDAEGAQLLDRTLNSANLRYLRLLDALRVESAPSRRVLMKATGAISVLAEERT